LIWQKATTEQDKNFEIVSFLILIGRFNGVYPQTNFLEKENGNIKKFIGQVIDLASFSNF